MADRRIDQLTEAEDISDEDLFVIWKENISQTRSIKKGTMNLASKDYVNNLVAQSMQPDWDNAVAVTASQIQAGYLAPNRGIMIITGRGSTATTSWITVNNIKVGYYFGGSGSVIDCQVNTLVNKDDVIKSSNLLTNDFTASFVPFKTFN